MPHEFAGDRRRQARRMACSMSCVATLLGLLAGSLVFAGEPQAAAKTIAPMDLTGYWVSVVTEDWRFRMLTPGKGEYAGIPINQAAKNAADAWQSSQDAAPGERCKAYGAGALMRVPGRLRITWADANTLKIETDSGMQTRLLHFGKQPPAAGSHTWQGQSEAAWEDGALKVVTRQLRAGYLRANGVPYSEQAQLTEYWDTYKGNNADQWLVITSLLADPVYLQEPYAFSPNFKKERDGSKWAPRPCED